MKFIAGSPKFGHIVKILHQVNKMAAETDNEKMMRGVDKFFDIKMVTTDKLNRRGGLGTDLLRRSVKMAESLGFKACKTEATGIYSRKAFERLGFSPIVEFPYSEYVDDDGVKVFEGKMGNHKCVTFLFKKIQNSSCVNINEENE